MGELGELGEAWLTWATGAQEGTTCTVPSRSHRSKLQTIDSMTFVSRRSGAVIKSIVPGSGGGGGGGKEESSTENATSPCAVLGGCRLRALCFGSLRSVGPPLPRNTRRWFLIILCNFFLFSIFDLADLAGVLLRCSSFVTTRRRIGQTSRAQPFAIDNTNKNVRSNVRVATIAS